MRHYHAGHNDAGYLPESEVESFTTFADARDYMSHELTGAADAMATWDEEHDCDNIPCPTYGDYCVWQLANQASFAAEELRSENGPGWWANLSDGRSLPVTWWIAPCDDEECAPHERHW